MCNFKNIFTNLPKLKCKNHEEYLDTIKNLENLRLNSPSPDERIKKFLKKLYNNEIPVDVLSYFANFPPNHPGHIGDTEINAVRNYLNYIKFQEPRNKFLISIIVSIISMIVSILAFSMSLISFFYKYKV